MLTPFWLALVVASPAPSSTVTPFRTTVSPRIDPVFGDSMSLRRTVDRFLSLQSEMEQVRNEFSAAVHGTLAEISGASQSAHHASKSCPPSAPSRYQKALAAGGRYLALGRAMEARFREIRRADELGDAAGLTPDYRLKVKKVAQAHGEVLRDFQEMRVAFYDQLGAEMRHAGCEIRTSETPAAPPGAAEGGDAVAMDPSDPSTWTLDDPSGDPESSGKVETKRGPHAGPAVIATTAPSVWIEIDNSHCARPSQLVIDGNSFGPVAARKRTSVRTHAGPHEICVMPTAEKHSCGDPGTLRQAYFYEGWSLTVRCDK